MPLPTPAAGLAPESLVEIDDLLTTAQDAYERAQAGRIFARNLKGRITEITAAHRDDVQTGLVEIEHDALPWPLLHGESSPVLVSTQGDSPWRTWKAAGEITSADELLLPEGPLHSSLVSSNYHISGPGFYNDGAERHRYTVPHNGLAVFGLGSLVEVEPTTGRTYSVHGLPRWRVFEIERAFDLPGSRYDRRKSSQVCTIRREMAEIGLPLSLIGCPVGAMHNQLKRQDILSLCAEAELPLGLG